MSTPKFVFMINSHESNDFYKAVGVVAGREDLGNNAVSDQHNLMRGHTKLLVVLGHKNDSEKKLCPAAELRCQKAAAFLKADSELMGLCTGAFGDFNLSDTPHGELMRRRLIALGVPEEQLLPSTQSGYTVSDAYAVLRLLKKSQNVNEVTVVTSKFHMERTRFIFGRVLQKWPLRFEAAPDPDSEMSKSKWCKDKSKDETQKLNELKEKWVDVASFDLEKFPATNYTNLGNELRHYDNLSVAVLGGAVVVCGGLITKDLSTSCFLFKVSLYVLGMLTVFALWGMYTRFADTAASARQVIKTLDELYGMPGLGSTTDPSTCILKCIKERIKKLVSFLMALMIIALAVKLSVLIWTPSITEQLIPPIPPVSARQGTAP